MLGYSNEVNPFGDTNLLKPFVWGKKQDQVKEQKKNKKEKKKKEKKKSSSKKKKDHRSSSSSSDDSEDEEEENEEEKRLKLLQEIEKVRQRRETREKELEDMQRLRDEEQRLRELAAYSNWQDKEEEFHLEQIKERTKLRLLTNRCHLIDRIITNIVLVEAARHIFTIFQNNHKREVEELLALSQLTSSSQGKWKEEEEGGGGASSSSLQQKKNNPNRKLLALLVLPSERDSPVDIILQDQRYLTVQEIKEVLEDLLQLQQLDERRQLTKYKDLWTSLIAVLSSLEKKKQRQEQLFQQQGASFMSSSKRDLASFHESIADDVAIYLKNKTMAELVSLEAEITQNIAENKKSQTIDLDYWEYMVQEIQFKKHKIVINQVNADVLKELKDLLQSLDQYGVLQKQSDRRQGEDRVFLYRQKQENASESNTSTNKGKGGNYPVIQDSAIDEYMQEMENEVGDGMDESEETKMLAADEIFLPIPDQQYHSQDKYRPRKPRYFNRVKTGWDRNKYNLTHYDPDNPPPKMIQGYKFTIFYPDLIDKTVTPRYFIEPCPDSISSSLNSDGVAEFVMIRFHAGPPYEDIAFKIINKQWDTHKRSGFISTFDRGILQLHFNFKRVFYRR